MSKTIVKKINIKWKDDCWIYDISKLKEEISKENPGLEIGSEKVELRQIEGDLLYVHFKVNDIDKRKFELDFA